MITEKKPISIRFEHWDSINLEGQYDETGIALWINDRKAFDNVSNTPIEKVIVNLLKRLDYEVDVDYGNYEDIY